LGGCGVRQKQTKNMSDLVRNALTF